MYNKVATDMKFVEREKETLEFWKQNEVFEKSVELRKGRPAYTFFDGPPTANGKPHIGHVLTRSIKDIIPRYKTMKGYDVLRKAGWDTHGLPVELEVEKQLGLDGKEQIEAYGVEPFIKKCKDSVWKYEGEWEDMSERVGYWADMKKPYVTYDDNYIESVWWALKTIYDKGLLYKGYKIVPYCPRCGTALASHEVAQGYKDVEETSAIAKFYLKDGSGTAILAWTTTPWTLPSNVALCVNANETYVKVKKGEDVYILAEALVEKVLGEGVETLDSFKGETLVGTEYEPLFELPVKFGTKKGYRVVADDYVTLSDGTGVVHIAPAFGEDDNRVGKVWELPFLQFVNASGHISGGTPWDGAFVKDADKLILDDLRSSGKLFSAPKFTHNYPFCWRCDTPLIYYARESWFIKMTAVKDKLMAFNRSVNWVPETIKEGRMGNFIDNVIDWGISRERYWGTPLPVWTCECGHVHVIGSKAELRQMSDNCPDDIELHKPYIDRVNVICPVCGKPMKREPVVIDCWFDSGSMPFAQWHYPFENKEEFERRYPAAFISEAVDQTRGWFYTLLAIATCLFDKAPFENCVVLGLVCDMDGKKMSKHLGNVVNPWEVLDKQGADAVRWYFYTGSMPWLPSRFSGESVSEYQRKFMGTLWNTYAFYILYAEIDKFNPTEHQLVDANLSAMDKWVLSRLNTLIKVVDANLDSLRITEAGREIGRFTDELSNWYVRRCRDRYWGSEMTADKEAAYMTLYTVLDKLSLLCAPFVPFMSEEIYQNMVRSVDSTAPLSIHLCDFPVADEKRIDSELETNMERVLELVTLGRSARNNASMKIRQPLSTMYVQGEPLDKRYVEIIEEELNVRSVEFVSDASSFLSYRCKPQLKTLGPRYGKLLPKLNAFLQSDPDVGNAIVRAHNGGGDYTFELEGTEVTLQRDDVLVSAEQRAGFVSETDNGLTVVLDTNLTDELLDEGMVRELVSKLQTMRKEAGFEVADHITIGYCGSEHVAEIFNRYAKEIMGDTLGEAISDTLDGYEKEWNINKETVTLCVKRV
ncbi:MAG: isoleucine--tRNA ligase [Eubacteriales bacterium]|nr:isoleucine--tRNA ligase [Eubacteriales bacterium]